MTLNQLIDYSESKGIVVDYANIHANALSMSDSNADIIVLNNSCIGTTNEKVYIAEELGHCMHHAWYNDKNSELFSQEAVRIAEGRANASKIKSLISVDELLEAYSLGATSVEDLADYFDLPIKIINEILSYYHDNEKLLQFNGYMQEYY